MKTAPINYPCVMLEKNENSGNISTIKDKKFALILDEKMFFETQIDFEIPIIIHYYSVINEAVELLGLKFCNRSKTYVPKIN